jgi:prepilin-type N-terminal cleavage/methylation domain-containing protein
MNQRNLFRQSAFTIVELLIVIVVIGILAAITVVAYNGVQQRSQNTQTTQALASWIKALKLYKADKGQWPSGFGCLGEGYLYGPNGTDTSGVGQCRQSSATNAVLEVASFNNVMKPYLGGGSLPTPAFITSKSSDTMWWRGAMYAYGGGSGTDVYMQASYAGSVQCTPISGVTSFTTATVGGNTVCHYVLGLTTDP